MGATPPALFERVQLLVGALGRAPLGTEDQVVSAGSTGRVVLIRRDGRLRVRVDQGPSGVFVEVDGSKVAATSDQKTEAAGEGAGER